MMDFYVNTSLTMIDNRFLKMSESDNLIFIKKKSLADSLQPVGDWVAAEQKYFSLVKENIIWSTKNKDIYF